MRLQIIGKPAKNKTSETNCLHPWFPTTVNLIFSFLSAYSLFSLFKEEDLIQPSNCQS